jgi:long-chain fatty acid transport protein
MNRPIFFTLIALLCSSGQAGAGGLFVPGNGTQAMGRADAFVAKADDPSALHHNPAGLARTTGTVIFIGANLLDYSLTFARAGVYEDNGDGLPYAGQPYPTVENQSRPAIGVAGLQAVPLIAVASDLGGSVPGLRVALGVMAPNAYPGRNFGEYQLEDPGVPPPPQRYDVVDQEAATVLPSIAASYSIGDTIDIGARFSWGFASLQATTYTWALRNFSESVDNDGEFRLDVKDNFVPGFGAGVLFRPVRALEIGLAYSSALDVNARGKGSATLGSHAADIDGDGQNLDAIVPLDPFIAPACAAGGQPGALETCLKLSLPRTATLGARWIVRDRAGKERADVEFDVRWENWSAASDYEILVDGQSQTTGLLLNKTVIRHGFQDVLSVRLGGAYAMPVGAHELTVRGGVAHDTRTAPDTWQRVDVDGAARTTLALGASYRMARVRIDLAGGVVLEGDRTVPECNPDVGMEGCPPGSGQEPVADREAPDPAQPLFQPSAQFQSPFNGGEYSSRYLMLSLGLSTWF